MSTYGSQSPSSKEYVEELEELRRARVVADIGAGRGEKARWLARHGAGYVIEIDVNVSYLLRQAREAIDALIERVQALAERLPIREEAVDAILAWNVLMWTEMAEALREMARIAEANARLVASLYRVRTGREWSREEVRRLLEEAGFRIMREKYTGVQYRVVARKSLEEFIQA